MAIDQITFCQFDRILRTFIFDLSKYRFIGRRAFMVIFLPFRHELNRIEDDHMNT